MSKKLQSTTGISLDASILQITPQVAKEMLSTSFRNRPPQKARIRRYVQAMRNGEWIIAQPIMMNCDGSLVDGQHRLRAVCVFGKPIEFLVVKGFDRDGTFGKVDDVGPRRLKDWLHVQGENMPEILAGVIGMAAKDEAGLIPTTASATFQLTPIEGCEFLKAHPKLRESVAAPGTVNLLVSRTMACFCHYKFAQLDKVVADSFFIELVMGDVGSDFDPMLLLRERLKSDQLAKAKLSRTERLALIFKAWNAIRTGNWPRVLRWRSTGDRPEAFPEVI